LRLGIIREGDGSAGINILSGFAKYIVNGSTISVFIFGFDIDG
jgi:hypothetical protein